VSNFSTIAGESTVTELNATFSGLTSNTQYYGRVRTIGHQGIATSYTSYGSTTTPPSSTPIFINGSFEVSNSQGQFIDSSLYTDTTTPSIRIQTQSNYSPGLSVTDTPSHLALWRLDDGTGSSAIDGSKHNKTLSLVNSPSWISGKLGNAIDLNGSSQYGTSTSLTPWRNATGNNQWAVNMWFRTTLGRGFLFQTASVNTLGGATYDAELSWYDATGKFTFEVTTSGGARQYIQASGSYTDGNWHFVTAVLNASGMYLFVDGSQVASGIGVNSTTARTYAGPAYAWIGAATTAGANMGGGTFQYFPGDIDDVLISTVPLSLTQHQELYALGNKGIAMGAPAVEISTQTGTDGTWVSVSTLAWTITGTNGTTSAQTLISTLPVAGIALRQTTSAGADTNRVGFISSSLDSNLTTLYFTILVDTTPPIGAGISSLVVESSEAITVNLVAASDALSGLASSPYRIERSTDVGFSVSHNSGFIAGTSYSFSALRPNTTQYFRVVAKDAAGNISLPSSSRSTVTLAKTATNLLVDGIYFSSITYSWTPHPVSPSSETAKSYVVQISTLSNFSLVTASSSLSDIQTSSWTPNGLYGNTTYYFRVGSLNWTDLVVYSVEISTLLPRQLHIGMSTDTVSAGQHPPNAIVLISTSIVITNESNTHATYLFRTTTTASEWPWAIGTTQDIDQFILWMIVSEAEPVGSDFSDEDKLSEIDIQCTSSVFALGAQTCISIPPGEQRTLWFRIGMPPVVHSAVEQTIRVIGTAVAPD
jgi:hypothetical protein